MPIEIRELVIRATVESGDKQKPAGGEAPDLTRADMVAECVEQVLEIFRQRAER